MIEASRRQYAMGGGFVTVHSHRFTLAAYSRTSTSSRGNQVRADRQLILALENVNDSCLTLGVEFRHCTVGRAVQEMKLLTSRQ